MGKLRLAATAAALTVAAFAAPAFAQVSSAADCDYEGGEVFNVQGATVCLVQIRPEEYRDNEAYDGQQLGISECPGDTLSNGTFCKITLVPAPPKPEVTMPVETSITDTASDAVIDAASDMATDAASSMMEDAGTKMIDEVK